MSIFEPNNPKNELNTSDMMRFISMMNEGVELEESAPKQKSPLADATEGQSQTDAMKAILEAFNSAKPVEALVEKSESSPDLFEALNTEITEDGIKIYEWTIETQEDDNGLKSYNVLSETSKPIAAGLHLYDVAYGIVKHLNEGKFINDQKVLDLLRYDSEYADARSSARYYKHMYESGKNPHKEAIYEDRFNKELNKAKHIRGTVRNSVLTTR